MFNDQREEATMAESSTCTKCTFTGLESYKLTGVTETDRELGHGSYATVQELEYMGLKCAGKKIHVLLLEQGDTSYTVRRFEEECRILSQVRHPNIVQFLGVYFQQGQCVPTLVMEFLPTNLTSCIEKYGILPKEISYSILHDVALGLCYLHSQTPPIIHRDLSSNNVLLTGNMTAKISDLGVAKIFDCTHLQMIMTQTPGTPAFMPPEANEANCKYNASVDVFSYGILMIHMFSGRWPQPQVGPNRMEDGQLKPVTEAKRREVFLQAIGSDHPLMELILQLINNDPNVRPQASEIVKQLTVMALQFPASFANRLDMLRHIEELTRLRKEAQEIAEEVDRLNRFYSSQVEGLTLQLRDLNSQHEQLKVERQAECKEMNSKVALYEDQIQNKDKAIKQEREEYTTQLAKERDVLETQITDLETQIMKQREEFEERIKKQKDDFEAQNSKQKEEFEAQNAKQKEDFAKQIEDFEIQLASERESCRRLTSVISESKMNTNCLQQKVLNLETESSRKDSTIEKNATELESKSRSIKEKESIISGMRQQLIGAREYLTTKKQVIQACITWKQCKEMPVKSSRGMSTVINGKVYYGGGDTDKMDDHYIVYCYDQSQDNWTTLPPLPVRWFGLGQVKGRLVAVGGWKKSDDSDTNEIFRYSERSKKWKQTIPPMPTCRRSPSVLSVESALVVAGGTTPDGNYTDAVEIFKPDTSLWYTADPLISACRDISVTAIGTTCYAIGGYKHPSYLNQALYASVDDLLRKAVPSNQPTDSGSSDTHSAWKTMPDTPTFRPTAAVLAGHLIAVGGKKASNGTADMKEVYMYSPSTNTWIYISDLPAPRTSTIVTALTSTTEILVIRGRCLGDKVNTVYIGTIHLKV